jgi:hypothetical protein
MLFETKVNEYDKSMKNVKRNEQSEIIKDTKAKVESEIIMTPNVVLKYRSKD